MNDEMEIGTIMAAGLVIIMCLAIISMGFCSLIDSIKYDSECDSIGPGYVFVPRMFFIGEPSCRFDQGEFDRDTKTVYLKEVD